MMNSIVKNGVMLGAFAIVTTGLIATTFFGTESRIAEQEQQKLMSLLNEVVPQSLYDNELYADCTAVSDPLLGKPGTLRHVYRARLNGESAALAIEAVAPDGYSGDIAIVIGVTDDMTVTGVRTVRHQETPGLGDKIELSVSDWITSFSGESFDDSALNKWQVKKDGGKFDQFTGATITPRAVTGAVKRALLYVEANRESLFALPVNCMAKQPGGSE